MLTRFARRQGREPSSIAADATYGNGEFLQWLLDRGITPYNGGQEVHTKKLNPACRLQKDMLGTIKSVKRALVLLREEEQIALKAEKPEKDEFEGLD